VASTAAAIRTIALSKSYGSRLAVDHLDLQVERAELFGFLGPNGAGKTTTIRMALGLIAPTGGSVEILGQEVRSHRAQVLPGSAPWSNRRPCMAISPGETICAPSATCSVAQVRSASTRCSRSCP